MSVHFLQQTRGLPQCLCPEINNNCSHSETRRYQHVSYFYRDPGRAPRCLYSTWLMCGSVWLPPTLRNCSDTHTHTHSHHHHLPPPGCSERCEESVCSYLSASSTETCLSLSKSILLPAERRNHQTFHPLLVFTHLSKLLLTQTGGRKI